MSQALRERAPASQSGGLEGMGQEASMQLPVISAAATRRPARSANPFADDSPFPGATSVLPAGDATPLIGDSAAGEAETEDQQPSKNSPFAGPRPQPGSKGTDRSSIYITANADTAGESISKDERYSADVSRDSGYLLRLGQADEGRLHAVGDPSGRWSRSAQQAGGFAEGGSAEGTIGSTGNPFASFLGNPFGLAKRFGSFRAASGWPSATAFSALRVRVLEILRKRLPENVAAGKSLGRRARAF